MIFQTLVMMMPAMETCFRMLSPVRKRGSEPVRAWQSIAWVFDDDGGMAVVVVVMVLMVVVVMVMVMVVMEVWLW